MHHGLRTVTRRATLADKQVGRRRRAVFQWMFSAHGLTIALVLSLMLDTPALSAPATAQVVEPIAGIASTVG